jgi:hypothetical protein
MDGSDQPHGYTALPQGQDRRPMPTEYKLEKFSFMWLVHQSMVKTIPVQAWTAPSGSRRLRLPEVLESRHMKAVRLSALRTGRL